MIREVILSFVLFGVSAFGIAPNVRIDGDKVFFFGILQDEYSKILLGVVPRNKINVLSGEPFLVYKRQDFEINNGLRDASSLIPQDPCDGFDIIQLTPNNSSAGQLNANSSGQNAISDCTSAQIQQAINSSTGQNQNATSGRAPVSNNSSAGQLNANSSGQNAISDRASDAQVNIINELLSKLLQLPSLATTLDANGFLCDLAPLHQQLLGDYNVFVQLQCLLKAKQVNIRSLSYALYSLRNLEESHKFLVYLNKLMLPETIDNIRKNLESSNEIVELLGALSRAMLMLKRITDIKEAPLFLEERQWKSDDNWVGYDGIAAFFLALRKTNFFVNTLVTDVLYYDREQWDSTGLEMKALLKYADEQVDIGGVKKVIIPVFYRSHWVTLVFEKNLITLIDSMSSGNARGSVFSLIDEEIKSNKEKRFVSTEIQKDCVTCGIHVVVYSLLLESCEIKELHDKALLGFSMFDILCKNYNATPLRRQTSRYLFDIFYRNQIVSLIPCFENFEKSRRIEDIVKCVPTKTDQ